MGAMSDAKPAKNLAGSLSKEVDTLRLKVSSRRGEILGAMSSGGFNDNNGELYATVLSRLDDLDAMCDKIMSSVFTLSSECGSYISCMYSVTDKLDSLIEQARSV
ncbi:MAG: hypothetical protein LBT23_01720 [Synergistaceae bacterium]|jgi:hypothetical protein|nr:hypothetical protein [Synergistaceae bacterium]